MDKATKNSLSEILDYLYADEEKHWREAGESESGHLFHDIMKVSEWLDAA
jgi:hypothetical protein